jgi:hypothetical protein
MYSLNAPVFNYVPAGKVGRHFWGPFILNNILRMQGFVERIFSSLNIVLG